MSLELVMDENLSNRCQKNLVYPYAKLEAKNKNLAPARKDSKE